MALWYGDNVSYGLHGARFAENLIQPSVARVSVHRRTAAVNPWSSQMTAFLLFFVFLLYISPVYIARWRKHPDYAPLLFTDLLLGWTVIVWFYCLLWSLNLVDPYAKSER